MFPVHCKRNLTYIFAFQDIAPAQPTTEPKDSHTVNVENAGDGTKNGNSPGIFLNCIISL